MADVFSLAPGHEASCTISDSGYVTISLRSSRSCKFKVVKAGTACVKFVWAQVGNSRIFAWGYLPEFLDEKTVEYTTATAEDGLGQEINVEFGHDLFPAAGFLSAAIEGEIKVPAVHFDGGILHPDLWVFMLRSPQSLLKISVDKPLLHIAHHQAQATVQVASENTGLGGTKALTADVAVYGEGFKKVQLIVTRSLHKSAIDQIIGELNRGTETFSWKPILRNFDVVLTADSNMNLEKFSTFLKYLGAEPEQDRGSLGAYLPNDFVLCDGPDMDYNLQLVGAKSLVGHEKDKTKITLHC